MSGPPFGFPGVRREAPAGYPIASFQDVDITSALEARPLRVPDYEREHDASVRLAAECSTTPDRVLQTLTEIAVELCGAHTAGVSLLDGDVSQWEAVAGVFASSRGTSIPRESSPVAACLDRDSAVLLSLPDRAFPALYADPRFVELLLIPFRDRGQPIGAVWIASHSDGRRFDREDARIIRILAGQASAAWQLWNAFRAAADANLRKDRLLATLGHELRNPLSAIAASAAVIERQMRNDAVAARALSVIARQTHRVERLAGDLLDSSRLAAGKLRLERKPVNLWEVVNDAVDACVWQFERRGLEVHVDLPSAPAVVEADADRLSQVFANLIDNAAKFTPEGGRVSIAGASDGSQVSVSISDSGPGIPRDQLQRIFEPFAQLRDANDGVTGGLGLGLSLVRTLAELHGGTVSAASGGAGEGSCFSVRLPVAVPNQLVRA